MLLVVRLSHNPEITVVDHPPPSPASRGTMFLPPYPSLNSSPPLPDKRRTGD